MGGIIILMMGRNLIPICIPNQGPA